VKKGEQRERIERITDMEKNEKLDGKNSNTNGDNVNETMIAGAKLGLGPAGLVTANQ